MSIHQPTAADGVSVQATGEPVSTVPETSQPLPQAPQERGLGVGLSVLLTFVLTILAALGDTAINGSITVVTGIVFVIVSVIVAGAVRYSELSAAIITPPLAYFTAILIAGQADLLAGERSNLLLREGAMIVAGLAFNAPWIFAGTGAAALIVVVRRWILHR